MPAVIISGSMRSAAVTSSVKYTIAIFAANTVLGLTGNARKNSVSLEKYKHVNKTTTPKMSTNSKPVVSIKAINSLSSSRADITADI